MFEGQVDSAKKLNILYDDVERYYHMIIKLTGVMASKYVCKWYNKACTSDVTHVCDQTCSDCMTNIPCAFSDVRIPCVKCNRHFRSRTCSANHNRVREKTMLRDVWMERHARKARVQQAFL